MQRTIRFALPVIFFGIGLMAGGWLAGAKRTRDSSAATDGTPGERSPGSDRHAPFAVKDEMLTMLMSAIAEEEPLLRSFRLREALGKLSSAELGACFDRIIRMDDRDRRNAALVPLIARWVALDPAAARDAIQPFRDRARAQGQMQPGSPEYVINEAWARAFPEATLAEIMAAPDSFWAQTLGVFALETLGAGDPAKQLEALSSLPAGRLRDNLCVGPLFALAGKDFAAAEAQVELISSARQRARLRLDILGKLAGRDPAAAIQKMVELSSSIGNGARGQQLVGAVLNAAASQDPSAALAAVDSLPENLRTAARHAALIGWAGKHPNDALDWAVANGVKISEARQFTSGSVGSTWYSMLTTVLSSDREKTLAWIRSQPASTERDQMLNSAIWNGSWEQRISIYNDLTPASQKEAMRPLLQGYLQNGEMGTSTAEAWVKALPAGETRIAAVQNLVSAQVNSNGDRVDGILETWPTGAERDAALRGIAATISYRQPQRSVEFASQIEDPQARFHALRQVAGSWLTRDETAARTWIAAATQFSPDEKRVIIRQFEER